MTCYYSLALCLLVLGYIGMLLVDKIKANQSKDDAIVLRDNRIRRLQEQIDIDELISKAELKEIIKGIEVEELDG